MISKGEFNRLVKNLQRRHDFIRSLVRVVQLPEGTAYVLNLKSSLDLKNEVYSSSEKLRAFDADLKKAMQ